MSTPGSLDEIIRTGIEQRATDIHLEPGIPIVFRVDGSLKRQAMIPSASLLKTFAQKILDDNAWDALEVRGSADFCRKIAGVQCRMNIMKSDRGTGFAIRLLSTNTNTLRTCNLHPDISHFLDREAGLIILTGPTGSGKSTTLSALIEEINQRETRHIITLESPIEYRLVPKKSIIRQREVGRHTPSYEQGLLDSLREDPDVLVVGEMREAEAMRLTLNAAETGHLVLATMHSASAADAIYRIMMSFPPERQSSVLAQIADSLIAVVSHRMTYRPTEHLLVPSCEVLIANHAVRNVIRKGDISKMPSMLQTGGPEGMYTFERYQSWLDQKTDWVYPQPPVVTEADSFETEEPALEPAIVTSPTTAALPRAARYRQTPPSPPARESATPTLGADPIDLEPLRIVEPQRSGRVLKSENAMRIHKDGRIEIPEVDLDLNELVKEFKGRASED